MKITRYEEIPRFPAINYSIDVPIGHLKEHLRNLENASIGDGLQLCPDFQRGHVWNREQQSAYMEFVFRGGKSGRDIYMNHPGWMESWKGDFVLVDGLQRITAALAFLDNEVPIFGSYKNEFDRLPFFSATLRIHVAKLQTRAEVLQWYIDFNAGGTPHADAEIERVRAMIEAEKAI